MSPVLRAKTATGAILPCLAALPMKERGGMKRSYFNGKLIAVCTALFLSACGREGVWSGDFGLDKLQKGVATEAQVRSLMGEPDSVHEDGGGIRTLEYPKGPQGITTWMVRIDADGVMSGYEQVLTDQQFARVQVGMTREQVRRVLGRPRSVVPFQRKQEEVWDWKYQQAHEQRLFNVHFDMHTGTVRTTSISEIGGY